MKKKNIIVICIVIVFLFLLALIIYFNQKNKNEEYITAKVLIADEDYLLVSTEDEIDYLINTTDTNYKEGDTLKLKLKITNDKTNPKEATSSKITLIEENTNVIEDDQEDKITPPKDDTDSKTENQMKTNNPNNNITDIDSNKSTTPTNNSNNNITEDEIIESFNELDIELTNYNGDETKESTIKEKFVKLVDFIFYGGEIGGKTFHELSNTTKLKIITLALKIDSKIENKLPSYKETISAKYQNLKSKLVEEYLDITTTICQKDEEFCENAKEGFNDLKTSFSITWDFIKDIASKNLTKLKDWYEIWRYN